MPGSPLVYVVDDDRGMRETVVDILALAGIAAEGFGSGAAALAPTALPGRTWRWSTSGSPIRPGLPWRPA